MSKEAIPIKKPPIAFNNKSGKTGCTEISRSTGNSTQSQQWKFANNERLP